MVGPRSEIALWSGVVCAKMHLGLLRARGRLVPLSEHEQRILREIERRFHEQDPRFAKRVRASVPREPSSLSVKAAAAVFLAAFAMLLATFTASVVMGVLWVLVMFGSAVVFQTGLKRGDGQVRPERRSNPARPGLSSIRERLQGRIQRRRRS